MNKCKRLVLCLVAASALFTGCAPKVVTETEPLISTEHELTAPPSTVNPSTPTPEATADSAMKYSTEITDENLLREFENMPDFWGDWLPDFPFLVTHVKTHWSKGQLYYETSASTDEVKNYCDGIIASKPEYADGEWTSTEHGSSPKYSFSYDEHNPRRELDIEITSNQDGGSKVRIVESYREEDGY